MINKCDCVGIIEMYKSGNSLREIAKKYCTYKERIKEIIQTAGMGIRPKNVCPYTFDEVIEIYETGLSQMQVAKKLKIPRSTISKMFIDNGYVSRKSHGFAGTGTYRTWRSILNRCTNSNDPTWARYGGAGIKCCDEWMTFDGFYADMGTRPENTTIDRIDNKKGYSKENCRWADWIMQNNNKTNNRYLKYNGEEKTVAEWGRYAGLKAKTFKSRIFSGWSAKRAIETPVQEQNHKNNSHREAADDPIG